MKLEPGGRVEKKCGKEVKAKKKDGEVFSMLCDIDSCPFVADETLFRLAFAHLGNHVAECVAQLLHERLFSGKGVSLGRVKDVGRVLVTHVVERHGAVEVRVQGSD